MTSASERPVRARKRQATAGASREAAARKRQEAHRRALVAYWQRANVLFTTSLFTLVALVPYVALVLIGLRWDLGIPDKVGEIWLSALVAGWFSSLIIALYTLYTVPGMLRVTRLRWTAGIVFPPSTLPASLAFAHLRRRELNDEMRAEELLPQRSWRLW